MMKCLSNKTFGKGYLVIKEQVWLFLPFLAKILETIVEISYIFKKQIRNKTS